MQEVPGVKAISYERALELLWAGHRIIDPIYCEDGGIVGTFGLYRAALNPLGQVALLYANDADDLRVAYHEPKPVMMGDRDVSIGLDRLYPGLRWQGSSQNADAVTVLHAREQRTHEPWIMSEIERFEQTRTHDILNYGFLKRVSPTRWASQAIVYELEPEEHGLYTLRCILAPAKGWDLLHLNEWQNKLVGLAAISKPHMTMEHAQKLILRDFRQRVRSVMRGLDHFDKPREVTSAFEQVTALGLVSKFMRRKGTEWTHSLAKVSMKDFVTAIPALLVMIPFKGAGVMFTALSKLFDIGLQGSRQTLSNNHEQDISNQFWRRGIKARNIPDQYEPIDSEILQRLYFLDQGELGSLPKHGGITQPLIEETTGMKLKEITAIEYVLGTLHGPPGSVVEFFETKGEQPRLVVHQPNGLIIEHFPLIGCAFASINHDYQDIPMMVKSLFEGRVEKVLFIDDYSGVDFHQGAFSKVKYYFLDEAETAAKRSALSAIPTIDRLKGNYDLGAERHHYQENMPFQVGALKDQGMMQPLVGGTAVIEAARAVLEELPGAGGPKR